MSELISSFTSLPNLHPLLIHFPIAFLIIAIFFDLACFLFRRQTWLDSTAAMIYLVGGVGAGAAYLAGRAAADSLVALPPAIEPLIAEHSDWGLYTLLLFSAIAIIRAVIYWRNRNASEISISPLRLAVFAAALLGQWVLFQASDRGGALVYQHGVGVTRADAIELKPVVESLTSTEELQSLESRLVFYEDSSLIWEPLPQDTNALGIVLLVADQCSDCTVTTVHPAPGQSGLGLEIDGRSLLLLPKTFDDVHVEAELDLSDFVGSIGIAHHAIDFLEVEFFEIANEEKASLVTISKGARKELAEKKLDSLSNIAVLSVSASGSHLKGMIDGAVVVHAHKTPAARGGVGLLLDGKGTIFILRMKVTPL